MLANREPYIHERQQDGSIKVMHPASGLVTARRAGAARLLGGVGGPRQRLGGPRVVDRDDHIRVPPEEESYSLRRVWLTPEEERGYYYGFANEGLWPLCHLAHARPIFRGEDWATTRRSTAGSPTPSARKPIGDDPVVLVQDYHFALGPALIRERLPRATIITFWHIPWPNSERFGICPWRTEMLEGLLGSSIVGFHTQLHCNNFLDSVDRYLEARIDREPIAVIQHGRPTLVRPYPISIEWPSQWAASAPAGGGVPAQRVRRARPARRTRCSASAWTGWTTPRASRSACWPSSACSNGIRPTAGRFTFVQLAAPSRTAIERYRQLDEAVEKLTARINAASAATAIAPSSCCEPTTSRPRCSATTAPPTSATSAACTTA